MTAALHTLWPTMLQTVGAMQKRNIHVRSQCRRCGALMRVDLGDLVARHGAGWSLIDTQERCRMVGCDGAAFYLAARTYGAPWRLLIEEPGMQEGIAQGPAPVTAETFVHSHAPTSELALPCGKDRHPYGPRPGTGLGASA